MLDNYILISTAQAQEVDPGNYEILENMMAGFVNDPANQTFVEDLQDFQEGKWLVEYVFTESDRVLITCGRDEQALANQPAWLSGDIFDMLTKEDILSLRREVNLI